MRGWTGEENREPAAGQVKTEFYGPTMRRRINEIARFTKQPSEVAEFYAQILDREIPKSGEAFSFEVEGVNLFVHPVGTSPSQPGWPVEEDHIAFEVEDLDLECKRLRSLGVRVQGPQDFPWGRSAYAHDPDGRLVEFHGIGMKYE